MKKILAIYTLMLIGSISFAQTVPSITENYVFTTTCLTADCGKKAETIQYFDGLGRPKQVVNVKVSTTGKDLVTTIPYDGFGRQVDSWLPTPMSSLNGTIQTGVDASAIGFYGDNNPFSHKVLENSPLNRIQKQIQIGDSWQSKPVIFENLASQTTDLVKKYIFTTGWAEDATTYSLPTYSFYGDNTLYKNSVKDEDGNETIEFKNGQGQTVLVRKVLSATANADTYYVYNDYDQLTLVISPLASVKTSLDYVDLDDLCYQYRYDGRNRLVEKKLPGKWWEYMVYDRADRLILTRDTKMAQESKWLLTKYDQFGRVIYTGITPGGERAEMQDVIKNLVIIEERDNDNAFTKNGMDVFYSKHFYTDMETILSVHYYDTYPPGTQYPTANAIQGEPILEDTFPTGMVQSTKSLPVASFVKNIGDDNWTRSDSFYDRKGRSIGSYSYNHLGGYTKIESILDFTGVPQKMFTYHKRLNNEMELPIEETFTYDNQNRLVKHEHQVNNQSPEILAENTYNEIGQLVEKKVGGTTGAQLQTVDYKYNIRGWLTGVNNPANITTMGTDLFAYTIRYHERIGLEIPDVMGHPNLSVQPRYNGNIAEVDWNAVDEAGVPPLDAPYRYGYVYDGLNRLRAGFYQDPGNPGRGTNNEIIEEYDLNGNIKKLKRFAWRPKSSTPAKIDDLTYTYNGNKVTNIADTGNGSGYEGGNGLIEYDVNGNMNKMPDKGIMNITYNHLNLPTQITQQNITQYLYRADGVKLRKSYTINNGAGSNIINTEYVDGFQYVTRSAMAREAFKETDDHTLAAKTAGEEETFVNIDALIEVPNPTDATMALSFFPTAEGFYDYTKKQYIYHYKDHLGNVRLSYAKNTDTNELDVLDRNDFYPFGMNFVGYHSIFDAMGSAYNYKYNGKELQETGMYDYGARMYMADTGRWFVVDELAEKSRRFSPYTYALDNPILFVDPDGREASQCCGKWFNMAKTYYSGMAQGASQVIKQTYNGVKQVVTHPIATAKAIANDPVGVVKAGVSKSVGLMASVAVLPSVAVNSVKTGDATAAGKIAGTLLTTVVVEGGMAVATEGAGSLVRGAVSKAGRGVAGTTETAEAGLSAEANVVRGGTCDACQFANGSGVTLDSNGVLNGVSVNSAEGLSVTELSNGIRNGQVGTSTVGDIQELGGSVIPSPTPNNPSHATLSGITLQQAEQLFKPTIKNPSK